jgi:hypothetical protein
MCRTACTEPQYHYSRAIPLLPLWAIRPVQNLSSCARVTFTFTFYKNPPVGQGFLIVEDSRSHSDTSHSIELLWTSDQPNAETSN